MFSINWKGLRVMLVCPIAARSGGHGAALWCMGTSLLSKASPPFSILMRGLSGNNSGSGGSGGVPKYGGGAYRGNCWMPGRGLCSRERWLAQLQAAEDSVSEELQSAGERGGAGGVNLRDWRRRRWRFLQLYLPISQMSKCCR